MPLLDQLGQQAAGGALGAGMGLLLEGHQDRRQLKQQQKLQDMQLQGQMQMGQFNYDQQMRMWRETNYGAQMEQLAKAGLNPGLIYGMGGAGGATTGSQGGQVGGAQAPSGRGSSAEMGMGMMQMGPQLAMLEAQKKNLEAQTKKTEAETANLPLQGENIKAGTDLTRTNIQAVTAGIDKTKAETTNTQSQTALNNIKADSEALDLKLKTETYEQQVQTIKTSLAKMNTELGILNNDKEIQDGTKKNLIREINLGYADRILQMALTRATTANVKEDTKLKAEQILNQPAQRKYWADQIAGMWAQKDREGMIPNPENNEPDFLEKLLDKIPGIILGVGGKGATHTPIKGFQR